MILKSVNGTFCPGNVMGFLGCGDEWLIITSRFGGEREDYFFQYLLNKVLDFPNILVLEADADRDLRLFNFLLFLFPYYLKTAMRKGLFKRYIRHRYNDGNVKGTVDIARHIKMNTPFTGSVAYSQREFSYDNSLMGLVRHTLEFIKGKPHGNNLLLKVKDEVNLVISATPGYEIHDRQRRCSDNILCLLKINFPLYDKIKLAVAFILGRSIMKVKCIFFVWNINTVRRKGLRRI